MAEIEKKIEQLRKKISAKEARLEKLTKKISDTKSDMKSLKNEIEDMRFEIKQLELEQLSETLSQNGFTAADVAAAIAAGEIKKSQSDKPLSENANGEDRKEQVDTSTNSNDKEVTDNEAGSSGKALGST